MDFLIGHAKQSNDEWSYSYVIQRTVKELEPIMNEFYQVAMTTLQRRPQTECSKITPWTSQDYGIFLEEFIRQMCETNWGVGESKLYLVKNDAVRIAYNLYDATKWGNLYWKFLHLASILVSHAITSKLWDHCFRFPILVVHIDLILPCTICVGHYQTIKPELKVDGSKLHQLSVSLCCGTTIEAVYLFHNLISYNINKSNQVLASPKPYFTPQEFAHLYHVLFPKVEQPLINTYCDAFFEPMSPFHTIICTLMKVGMDVNNDPSPFVVISDYLKNRVYRENQPLNPRLADALRRILTLNFRVIQEAPSFDKFICSALEDIYNEFPQAIYEIVFSEIRSNLKLNKFILRDLLSKRPITDPTKILTVFV